MPCDGLRPTHPAMSLDLDRDSIFALSEILTAFIENDEAGCAPLRAEDGSSEPVAVTKAREMLARIDAVIAA